MRNPDVEITVTLTFEEAAALAAFFRRAGYTDFRECAANQDEAYRMLYAGSKLMAALERKGVA